MRPLWLLDFDGVVNAVSRRPDRSLWDDWATTAARAGERAFPVLYSRSVVDFICRASERVDVVWLTTWGGYTQQFPDVFAGMPVLPYVETPPGPQEQWGTGEQWWKLVAAQRLTGDGRPLIWTDDDLDWNPPVQTWARDKPSLMIAPRTHAGLLRRDLRAISEWLSSRYQIDVPVPASAARSGR